MLLLLAMIGASKAGAAAEPLARGRAGGRTRSSELTRARQRVRSLHASGEIRPMHATNSSILAGLRRSGGLLLSAAEVARQGISGAAREHAMGHGHLEGVAVGGGDGRRGLGMALAYADLHASSPAYNRQLLTDHELDELVRRYSQDEEGISKQTDPFRHHWRLQTLKEERRSASKAASGASPTLSI